MTSFPTQDPGAEACFRAICLAAAQSIDAALAIFLETENPAGPHKARVALRRLTTALDAFRPILRRKKADALRGRAKRIFRDLGLVRDSDVQLAKSPAADRQAENRSLRRRVQDKLRRDLAVRFSQDLLAEVREGGAIYRRSARAQALRQAPVSGLAAGMLAEAWQRCRGYGGSVKGIALEQRHDFRKDMKTLRYLAEFFADLFPGLDDEPFQADFRDIQDVLGTLNDYEVGLVIEGRKRPDRLPDDVRRALDQAEALWSRLSRARPPWEDQPTRRP